MKRVGIMTKVTDVKTRFDNVDLRPRLKVDGMSIEALEQGLQIDEHALDDALIHHPDMFYRVSKHLALVTSQRDAKKQELTEEEAKADGDIRETSLRHKDKTTDTAVKQLVKIDKDVVRVARELLDLNRQVGMWTALKEAFQARSYVLKDLVNLYIANYYGSNQDGTGSRGALRDHSASRVRDTLRTRRQDYERA